MGPGEGRLSCVAMPAGVSMLTVSHVINKTRKVHPDTQHAVEQAIKKVGCSPNR